MAPKGMNASFSLCQFSHLAWTQHRCSRKISAVTSSCVNHQDIVLILDLWAHRPRLWVWQRRFAVVDVFVADEFTVCTSGGKRHIQSDISNHMNETKHHIGIRNQRLGIIFDSNSIREYFVHFWFDLIYLFSCLSVFILSMRVFIKCGWNKYELYLLKHEGIKSHAFVSKPFLDSGSWWMEASCLSDRVHKSVSTTHACKTTNYCSSRWNQTMMSSSQPSN